MSNQILKKCRLCNLLKPTIMYHKRALSKDGLKTECKECAKKAGIIYKKNNAEKVKNSKRDSYLKNKEKNDINRFKDIEKIRDKNRTSQKKWREKNKILSTSNLKKIYKERMEVKKIGINRKKEKDWIKKQTKICFYCNRNLGNRFDVDHYIPISKGGAHEIENLRICCSKCNKVKGNKMPKDFYEYMTRLESFTK